MKNLKKHLMYTGLCLGILTAAVGVPVAYSATQGSTITINVALPDPDIILTGLTWSSGNFLAINNAVSIASATVTALGAVTAVPGTAGGARLIGANTTGSALDVNVGSVVPGAPSAAMSFQVSDDLVTGATVTLVGAAPDANLKIDTWTAGTPTAGTLTGFVGATGLGTLTLSATGTARVKFGAKLSTVPSASAFTTQAYTGVVRVTLSY